MTSISRDTQLTAVLLAPHQLEGIAETVGFLLAQTAREHIELLAVVDADSPFEWPQNVVESFGATRVVALPSTLSSTRSVGESNAQAVREAASPLVVFCEDHSFPEPEWAQSLINAHKDEKHAAVGPCVCNANPATAMSWTNFLLEYGAWTALERGLKMSHLPGHNSCYKRAILLSYGEELGAMLEAESVLHWDLLRRGHTLFLEAQARTHHMNFSVALPSAALRFHGGRSFASARSAAWPKSRRLIFALASPLIPLVRWNRILPIWRRVQREQRKSRQKPLPRFVPLLLAVALMMDALGEMFGYARGEGNSRQYLWEIEFNRRRFVKE